MQSTVLLEVKVTRSPGTKSLSEAVALICPAWSYCCAHQQRHGVAIAMLLQLR